MNAAEQHAALQSKIKELLALTLKVTQRLNTPHRHVFVNKTGWYFASDMLRNQTERIEAFGERAYPLTDKQVAVIEKVIAEQQAHIESLAKTWADAYRAQKAITEAPVEDEAVEVEDSVEAAPMIIDQIEAQETLSNIDRSALLFQSLVSFLESNEFEGAIKRSQDTEKMRVFVGDDGKSWRVLHEDEDANVIFPCTGIVLKLPITRSSGKFAYTLNYFKERLMLDYQWPFEIAAEA